MTWCLREQYKRSKKQSRFLYKANKLTFIQTNNEKIMEFCQIQRGNGTTRIQRITMNYFENLNSSKLDNIVVSTFLDICNLSQLN